MQRLSMSSSLVTIALLAVGTNFVFAQSGSRSYPPSGSAARTSPPTGSTARSRPQAPVALEGYCPVSIHTMQKWVRGNSTYQVAYDGRTYLLDNAQGKQMFAADPAKYVPALGGDCVVALAKTGKRVPGNIRTAAFHEGRLYLFANSDAKNMFLAQPQAYTNADLGLGGKCPVCQVNMGQSVAGKPEIAAFHKGYRYLFPAAEQRQVFLASPEKFVSAAKAAPAPQTGSSTRPPAPGSSARPPARSSYGSGSR